MTELGIPNTEAIGTMERLNGKSAMPKAEADGSRRKMTAIYTHEE
jgi:hypothetical protein